MLSALSHFALTQHSSACCTGYIPTVIFNKVCCVEEAQNHILLCEYKNCEHFDLSQGPTNTEPGSLGQVEKITGQVLYISAEAYDLRSYASDLREARQAITLTDKLMLCEMN